MVADRSARSFGAAWLGLCLAFAAHVVDEAATGFLAVYNPTVEAIRGRLPWLPVPTFTYRVWLRLLIVAVSLLLGLSVFAFRGAPWLRPLAYVFAVVMLLNGTGHTVGTTGACDAWGLFIPVDVRGGIMVVGGDEAREPGSDVMSGRPDAASRARCGV